MYAKCNLFFFYTIGFSMPHPLEKSLTKPECAYTKHKLVQKYHACQRYYGIALCAYFLKWHLYTKWLFIVSKEYLHPGPNFIEPLSGRFCALLYVFHFIALLTTKHRERHANLPAVIASKWVMQLYKSMVNMHAPLWIFLLTCEIR